MSSGLFQAHDDGSFYEDDAEQGFNEPEHGGGPRASQIGNAQEDERVVPVSPPEFPQDTTSQDGRPRSLVNQIGDALEETRVVPVLSLPESPNNDAPTMREFSENHHDDSQQLVEEIQYFNHPNQSPDNPTSDR